MVLSPNSGRSTPTHNRRDSLTPAFQADQTQPSTTSVKVVVRIRPNTSSDASVARTATRFQRTVVYPLNSTTLQIDSSPAAAQDVLPPSNSAVTKAAGKPTFTFDRVIFPDEGQKSVYACAEPLVESFLTGINVTILAYGQTSSGKSYTMGTDRTSESDDVLGEDRLGVTPRAVAQIFETMKERAKESRGGLTYSAKLSYIEIYNEDLIDLLAGDLDIRPIVQIREDKLGNIIWSGLREVKVTSALEVMTYLTSGSALRQTNATDMNAQSSRSHAIFSLTLTQRRYTGSGLPPTPPSPTSSRFSSRSPNLPRVSSPVPGSSSRSATPTNERPGSRFGLRPPSVVGSARSSALVEESATSGGSDPESWTSITSKFHFVDLAGSERLKRTAAAGDRVKEGISINAGLHALGNVISALGDPAKKSTHVPYRDSKLTRLLQDSLGGNAQTMMIACISPIEINLNETISTVKYANRARNIKNSAHINAAEIGWNDVEYLQRSLIKLRAELAALQSGDGDRHTINSEDNKAKSSSKLMGNGLDSITREIQDKYTDLSQRYAQLTAKFAASQSGETGVSASSLTRDEFAKAVEPIVEEYERSLSAIESQLALTKAALGHSEDEMRDLEKRVQEEAIANEVNLTVIDELKTRIVKLSDREATVEAYVRDLEARLKDYGDQDTNHGSAVSDLRKEITRAREQGATQEQYIRQLESRLSKVEETETSLRRHIDLLERDIARREEAFHELESRLTLLDTSGEQKLLLAELDDKERRVLNLERALDEQKMQCGAAESEVERLGKLAASEKDARDELQSQLRTLERASIIQASPVRHLPAMSTSTEKGIVEALTPSPASVSESLESKVTSHGAGAIAKSVASPDSVLVSALEAQVTILKASNTATLAELDVAQVKYRNAVKEIEDLNAQLQENGLTQPGDEHLSLSSAPSSPVAGRHSFGSVGDEYDETTTGVKSATSHASLASQTPIRTPRPRRSMPLAPQHRLSFLGRGQEATPSAATHLRSASLSKELSSAISSQVSSTPSRRAPSPFDRRSPSSVTRESAFGNFFTSANGSTSPTERGHERMRDEIDRLNALLKQRDNEIAILETRQMHPHSNQNCEMTKAPLGPQTYDSEGSLARSTRDPITLSPETQDAFYALRTSAESSGDPAGNTDRLDNLMRAMAKKESAHREIVESLENQLVTLRRQHDELTVLSRDQVVNMSSEIDQLRRDLDARPAPSQYENRLEDLSRKLAQSASEAAERKLQAESDATERKVALTLLHKQSLKSLMDEHAASISTAQDEHTAISQSEKHAHEDQMRRLAEERDGALRSQAIEHEQSIGRLEVEHSRSLADTAKDLDQHIRRHEEQLQELPKRFEIERAAINDKGEDSTTRLVERLNAEHSAVLQRRENDRATATEQLKQDHATALGVQARLHSESLAQVRNHYEDKLNGADVDHSSSVTRIKAEIDARILQLESNHTAALTLRSEAHEAALTMIQDGQARILAADAQDRETAAQIIEETHRADMDQQQQAGRVEFDALGERHAAELELLRKTLADAYSSSLETVVAQHAAVLDTCKSEHAQDVAQVRREQDTTVRHLTDSHARVLQTLEIQRDEARAKHLDVSANNAQMLTEHQGLQKALAKSIRDHEDACLAMGQLQSASPTETQVADSATNRADLDEQLGSHQLQLDLSRASVKLLETEVTELRQERDELAARLHGQLRASGGSLSKDSAQEMMTRSMTPDRATSPLGDLGRADFRIGASSVSNGYTNNKPPPPTPPPTMPPPPAPTTFPSLSGTSSLRSMVRSSSSSSIGRPSTTNSVDTTPGTNVTKPEVIASDNRLVKKIEEQDSQIARLSEQLTHCESDLQANIDLVNTLESALNDSERNLRKARVQMNDLAKERDGYLAQNEALRRELQESHTENETVRNSIVEIESQLQAERFNRERAKQDLERKLESVTQKGRSSKFNCF